MSLAKFLSTGSESIYRCKYGEVTRLIQSTYPRWSQDLQYLLQDAGALEIVLGHEVAPPANQNARLLDFNKREGLAVSFIYNSCGTEAKTFLRSIPRTSTLMWTALATEFNTVSSRAGREGLIREFNRVKCGDCSSVSSYITTLMDFKDILSSTDQAITDATFISRLTSTLPDTYDTTVQLLHQRGGLSVSEYITAIRQQEATLRIKAKDTSNANVAATSGSALFSEVDSRTRGHGFGWRGRGRSRRVSRGSYSRGWTGSGYHHSTNSSSRKPAGRSLSTVCWHCGLRGHTRRDCDSRQRGRIAKEEHQKRRETGYSDKNPGVSALSAMVEPSFDSVQALVITVSTPSLNTIRLRQGMGTEMSTWLIDSGATHHLCRNRDALFSFRAFEPCAYIPIRMGNNSSVKATGRGTVRILFKVDPEVFALDIEALYVPHLRMSLLSVGQLSLLHHITFTSSTCLISCQNNGCPVVLGHLSNNVWELASPTCVVVTGAIETKVLQPLVPVAQTLLADNTATADSAIPITLWHQRLAHLNYRAVSLITSLPTGNVPPCHTCIEAKHQQMFARDPVIRAGRPFELIHSDLCGPISSPSWSGSCYMILYIDDYTCWAYGYFLKSKESVEITQVFQEFQARVETAFPNWPIARFRYDNGRGEYDNTLFRGILRVGGIAFEPAPPYCQHKNGVAERMIRTIVGKARAILLDSHLPNAMWAEAIETALYLHSRSPTASLGNRSPYEILHGSKPELSHLRRFGCSASRLIPKEQRNSKFGPRSRECIMVGYVHDTTKIWRLWDPEFRAIVRSADVVFDESRTPGDISQGPGSDVLKELVPNSEGVEDFDEPDIIEPANSKAEEIKIGAAKIPMIIGEGRDVPVNPVLTPNAVLVPMTGENKVRRVIYKGSGRATRGVEERGVVEQDTLGDSQASPGSESSSVNSLLPTPKILKRAQESGQMLRRSLRRRKPIEAIPAQAEEVTEFVLGDDRASYADAVSFTVWRSAMKEEFDSLILNKTWEIVDRDQVHSANVIGCKWVFRVKYSSDRSIRYKARLVVRGFEQTEFGETYAPVARLTTFLTLVAFSARLGWVIHQMDVVTAFLNPAVQEEVFMALPEGIEWLQPTTPLRGVYRLKKALYGLKEAPRLWFRDIDCFLRSQGFLPTSGDANLYTSSSRQVILLLYIDDLLIASPDPSAIGAVKKLLAGRYQMTDLGLSRQFLGMELEQLPGKIRIGQRYFVESVLRRFNMGSCNGVWTPLEARPPLEFDPLSPEDQQLYQSIVGSIMYLMLGTRPDLAFTIAVLSKFSASAGNQHLAQAKRVLRYLQQTRDVRLCYEEGEIAFDKSLEGFSDSDWAGDLGDRKSTGGFVFLLSGCAVAWKAKKQTLVALSTTEAEYIAASEASREAVWLRRLVGNLMAVTTSNYTFSSPTVIYSNSTSGLAQISNMRHHERTKHIDIKFHYVRDLVTQGIVSFRHVSTHEMSADMLTKPLTRELQWSHMKRVGMETMA